jgi:hypothetical protein
MGPEAIVESENLRLVHFFSKHSCSQLPRLEMWRRHVQHAWWTADAESFKSANAFLVDFLDKKNAKELELEVNACSEFERYSG